MQSTLNFMTNLAFILGANGGIDTADLKSAQEVLTKEINKSYEFHNNKNKVKLKYSPNTESGIDQRLIDLSLGGQIEIKKLEQLIKDIKSGQKTGNYSLGNAQQLMRGEINRIARYHEIEITDERWNIFNSNLLESCSNNQVEISKFYTLIDKISARIVFLCKNQTKELSTNIRSLENVYYFKTNQQGDGFSCGFWTCFNAKAIEQLIHELIEQETPNTLLNLQRLNKISRNSMNSVESKTSNSKNFNQKYEMVKGLYRKEDYLQDSEVEDIAVELGINNFNLYNQNIINLYQIYNLRLNQNKLFVIKLNPANPDDINALTVNQKTILPNHLDGILNRALTQKPIDFEDEVGADIENRGQERTHLENVEQTMQLVRKLSRKFFKRLKQNLDVHVNNNTATSIHFACQTNLPHWILISILKFPNRKPVMTICDSLNAEIKRNIEYQEYIQILHKIFIEPYMNGQN